MSDREPWEDAEFRAEERAVGRRRLLAAAVMLLALAGVAGGSAIGAVASAHEDAAGAVSHQLPTR